MNTIELTNKIGTVVILGVYRPPSSDVSWVQKFNDLVIETLKIGPTCILADLNADLLKPACYSGRITRLSYRHSS